MPEKLYSAAEAAEQIGKDKSNIARVAKRIGVGQQIGRVWAFTAADVKKLAAAWNDGPGCPAFTEGNTLALEGVAKRWGKKRKKGAD